MGGIPRHCRARRGFSLIELAIVLTIVGLLLGAFLRFYSALDQKQRIETTRERLSTLRTSLIFYVLTHNRLPCPGSAVKEQKAGTQSADPCAPEAARPPEGVTSFTASVEGRTEKGAALDIWRGIIPVKDLQIDPQMALDGWGDEFTYAVSRSLTLPDGMRGNPMPAGHISVTDADGKSLLEVPGTGRFAIVSHGPSGGGAFTPDGGKKPCPAGTLSAANCTGGGTFVNATFSTAAGPLFFDNIVVSDDQNAGGTLLDRMAICTRKLKFYGPRETGADSDGCVDSGDELGAWHGICLQDPSGATPPQAILNPAVVQGGQCGCTDGFTATQAGSWLNPAGQTAQTGAMTALYTCIK